MGESKSELVRFSCYIVSMASCMYWEVLLSSLEETEVKDRQNCSKKAQINLLILFRIFFLFFIAKQLHTIQKI